MRIQRMWESLFPRSLRPGEVDFCLVGIGNPGRRYADTRHNVGFRVADEIAGSLRERRHLKQCKAECVVGISDDGCHIVAAKPYTFVNRSGESVAALLGALGLDAAACLVVVDDVHLPLGSLRLRRGGSDGGHRGLKSIVETIGSAFPRMRIGVGPLPDGINMVDFVLGRFSKEEEKIVRSIVKKASEAAKCFCLKGIEAAMNAYNSYVIEEPSCPRV